MTPSTDLYTGLIQDIVGPGAQGATTGFAQQRSPQGGASTLPPLKKTCGLTPTGRALDPVTPEDSFIATRSEGKAGTCGLMSRTKFMKMIWPFKSKPVLEKLGHTVFACPGLGTQRAPGVLTGLGSLAIQVPQLWPSPR